MPAVTPAPRLTTPFGYETRAAEVLEGVDLSGRRAVVTGGGSGIGIETARALAGAGAAVTLAVRRTDDGEKVAREIRSDTGNEDVAVAHLELTDRASIDALAAAWDGPLDILGHFALALALHDALAAAGDARIVSVSSAGHLRSPVIFDDLNYSFRDYDPFGAYGQSKTANVLFAVEATRRWADDGISANALMPGGISTPLQRHVVAADPDYMKKALERFERLGRKLKTPEQGAATSVLLAASPLLEGVGGRYFEDCNEAPVVDKRPEMGAGGVARYAVDPANAERLWDVSQVLIA